MKRQTLINHIGLYHHNKCCWIMAIKSYSVHLFWRHHVLTELTQVRGESQLLSAICFGFAVHSLPVLVQSQLSQQISAQVIVAKEREWVCDSTPGCVSLHVVVFLGKIPNPKLPPVCNWCVWWVKSAMCRVKHCMNVHGCDSSCRLKLLCSVNSPITV